METFIFITSITICITLLLSFKKKKEEEEKSQHCPLRNVNVRDRTRPMTLKRPESVFLIFIRKEKKVMYIKMHICFASVCT